MDVEMVVRTVQLILAPVVMMTTCAIMLSGLLGHYAAINDRLRAMTRERLELLRVVDGASGASSAAMTVASERLQEIHIEAPDLLHRHKLVRDSVLMVYLAILIFLASMFVIALAVVSGAAWAATAVLLLLLAGAGALLLGVLLIVLEVRISHRAIQYEVQRVSALGGDQWTAASAQLTAREQGSWGQPDADRS